MTTLSKILIFINLLFSLITGAMIVMVFTTRTNWRTGYEAKAREAKTYYDNYTSLKANFDLEKDLSNVALAQLKDHLKAEKDKIAGLEKERDLARDQARNAENEALKAANNEKKVLSSMEGMKVEVASLDKRLQEEQQRVKELGLQNKEYKAETIKARTDLETANERNRQLLARLIEVEKKLQNSQDTGTAKAPADIKNPPAEDVRGKVTATDDKDGWVTINLGSDNGLTKGHTMEVFRLKPKATYVGTLRIYDVRPNEAVGKLVGNAPRGRIQKDDEVASRILGSP